MTDTLRQDSPLFESLLWSRPQRKAVAGKILTIGGHSHDLLAPAVAFEATQRAGVGLNVLVLARSLPEVLLRTPDALVVEASKAGGISKNSETVILEQLTNADAMFWPGSIGQDSETYQLLEALTLKTDKPLVLAGDATDAYINLGALPRPHTYLTLDLKQLRELSLKLMLGRAVPSDIQLNNLLELLGEITTKYPLGLLIIYENQAITALAGRSVSTTLGPTLANPDINLAAFVVVLLAQFPTQAFEALATAAWLVREIHE